MKNITRHDFLKGFAAGAATLATSGILGAVASAEESGIYTPGTYTAIAGGISSDITVTMTFDANSITDVTVDVSGETAGIGADIGEKVRDQILSAQSAEIDGVAGASVSSNAVKTAVADCIAQAKGTELVVLETEAASAAPFGYVCADDWLGEAPVIDPSQIVETISADVVVCGSGHAGSQAALAAAQAGAKVAVLESQSEENYTTFGEDFASYNSKLLTDRGFGNYNTGEIVAEYVRRGGGRVSPEIIRLFVENSGEMTDNLVSILLENADVFDFDNAQAQVQVAYGMPDGSYYPIEHSGYKAWASTIQTGVSGSGNYEVHGRTGVSRLTELELYTRDAAEALGAAWYYENTATVLVQNENGDVTGVIAKTGDGRYVQYNASKGVILATGDFSGNADMCYNLLDDLKDWAVRAGQSRQEMAGMGRNGQGHKMGCWAGGFIEGSPRPTMDNGAFPGVWGSCPFLVLNAKGKRFMNEGMAHMLYTAQKKQPKGILTSIMDANFMQTVRNSGVDHGAPNFGSVGVEVFGAIDQMEQEMWACRGTGAEGGMVRNVMLMQPMAFKGIVYSGETLEELLGYLGYTGEALEEALRTIEKYNAMCDAGVDTEYGKDAVQMIPVREPPFFGAVSINDGTMSAGMATFAGLVTDENLNVLRADLTTPIKGLYACGNTLGQRFGICYSTPSAGASVGMALTHGRVCGKIVGSL